MDFTKKFIYFLFKFIHFIEIIFKIVHEVFIFLAKRAVEATCTMDKIEEKTKKFAK